ncbi:YceI family protein [Polaribacter sp. Hel1_85]|uniref:YceI family protein n=1 Tax=Polaribacter sp. Hel1_85 TaxID=1250005 RepID=UPI00052C579F|nr:YceI family protein [Polaribacter sp. Hel1_85]KGL64169.1 YceI family protein [Polaribacter sp. Hel1_85]
MKRVLLLSLLLVVAFNFSSCKSEKKPDYSKENKVEAKKSTAAFSLKNAKNEINFTAYKTSDKIPVGGQFKKIDITTGGEGNSIKEAINNAEFAIPVSSIFTKDTSRDFKIKKFFFGIMDSTKLLSGKLVIENDSIGYANIKMNGITEKVSFLYTIEANTFSMKATMDITKWNASTALNSLNLACKDLHKGADGVSKTWSDVALDIKSTF